MEITINETKVKQFLIQKIAAYWNGKTITITPPSGAHWSDHEWKWVKEIDAQTNLEVCVRRSKRVPGTHRRVTSCKGVITTNIVGD